MKKILLTAILIASSPSYAGMCESLGIYAEKVMTARQEGVKMSDALESSNDVGVLESIVNSAYTRPRYNSDKYKKKTIQEFVVSVEKMCYDAFRG